MKPLVRVAVIAELAVLMTMEVSHSFSAENLGVTLVAKKVQARVLEQIKLFGMINSAALSRPACESIKLEMTRVSTPPPSGAKLKPIPKSTQWSERWRVNECGVLWEYGVHFTADNKGRLSMEISPRGGGPGTVSCQLPDGKERLLPSASCTDAGGTMTP
jgi:hypothetical protein